MEIKQGEFFYLSVFFKTLGGCIELVYLFLPALAFSST